MIMKQTMRLFLVALLAGAATLGGYKFFVEETTNLTPLETTENVSFIPTTNSSTLAAINSGIDFTAAAEKSIHAVVHVKNTTISNEPTSMQDLFFGGGGPKKMIGTGSGVIISPDGYIITNNHVIDNSSELQVKLNNNKIYEAALIGTDPKTDIALIKIDTDEELPFIPFANSNDVKVGEWVLAVGNPFNLTSTVTAGIVSAKARDLNEFDSNPQSFIQTDAAVNRGNSGGALVNTQGQLVGINTAITSQTGSYVGYSFAVPSNVARKVVEDIMEYGDVQRAILGITGRSLNSEVANDYGVEDTQGVYVATVDETSGAFRGGIREGDVIKKIDNFKIGKFSDLSGYLGSKRPNDVVEVTLSRNGSEKIIPVTLIKLEVYEMPDLGLEVKNVTQDELNKRGLKNGVKITRPLTRDMDRYDWRESIIVKLNDQEVDNIDDVKEIMNTRDYDDPIKMTFVNRKGELQSFIFR